MHTGSTHPSEEDGSSKSSARTHSRPYVSESVAGRVVEKVIVYSPAVFSS